MTKSILGLFVANVVVCSVKSFIMRRIRTYLVAVLLGTVQFVIGEAINVNVWPTEVAIASPPNSTLPGCGDVHVFYIHIQRPCCMSVR